jgi:hypothetical protein
MLQNIRVPLHMYDLQTCEEVLKKSQRTEMDDEGVLTSLVIEKRLEENLAKLQQSIKNMSLSRNKLWCTICSSEGHTKDYCKFNDTIDPAVRWIQIETLCDI